MVLPIEWQGLVYEHACGGALPRMYWSDEREINSKADFLIPDAVLLLGVARNRKLIVRSGSEGGK